MPEPAQTLKPARKPFNFDKPDLLALLLCFISACLWLFLLHKKYVHFGYTDWDLAMYAQAVWELTQGSIKSSIFGTSFLTNHAEYIAFLLAPFYKLFPSAFTLIVFKVLAFTSGAFVFYLITRRLLDWKLGIAFMLLYLFHPANVFMLIYEFHFENLATVFIFLMFYFYLKKDLVPFLVSAFFATIIKENISLVVMMFGFFALLQKRGYTSGWVIGPALLGGLFFLINIMIVMPHLRVSDGLTGSNPYVQWYTQTSWWDNLTGPLARRYIYDLFVPFNILTFISPAPLLVGAPILLQHFLSPSDTSHTFFYHYAATAIIFLFLAAVLGLEKIQRRKRGAIFYGIIALTALSLALQMSDFLPHFKTRVNYWTDSMDHARSRLVKQIPAHASVISGFDFLDKLANREKLFSIHSLWTDIMAFTRKLFPQGEQFDFALIDWNMPWLWTDINKTDEAGQRLILGRLNTLYFSRPWHVVDASADITLLSIQEGGKEGYPLVENSPDLFADVKLRKVRITIGEKLWLVDLRINSAAESPKDTVTISFVWQMQEPTKDFLAAEIGVMGDGDKIMFRKRHPLGYTFNATPLWKKGQYVREIYHLPLSTLAPGEYTLVVSFLNISTGQTEDIVTDGQKAGYLNLNFCYQCKQ